LVAERFSFEIAPHDATLQSRSPTVSNSRERTRICRRSLDDRKTEDLLRGHFRPQRIQQRAKSNPIGQFETHYPDSRLSEVKTNPCGPDPCLLDMRQTRPPRLESAKRSRVFQAKILSSRVRAISDISEHNVLIKRILPWCPFAAPMPWTPMLLPFSSRSLAVVVCFSMDILYMSFHFSMALHKLSNLQ